MSRFGRASCRSGGPVVTAPPAAYYDSLSYYNAPLSAGYDTVRSNQTEARMLSNAINYGNGNYSYTGSGAPNFYGYSGIGYGGYQWPTSVGQNQDAYSWPIYYVTNNDPTVPVGMYYGAGKTYGTSQFNDLQDLMLTGHRIRLPNAALCPAVGGVGYETICANGEFGIVVVNKDTGEGWEMFYAQYLQNGTGGPVDTLLPPPAWYAQGAGYYPNFSTFTGTFQYQWGGRGTSLGAPGGLITMQDLRNVHAGLPIKHALAFATSINAGVSSNAQPAQRSDGPGANNYPTNPGGGANPAYNIDKTHEGSRFSFPANVDLSGCTNAMAKALAVAIRDYGMINMDTSGAVAFYVEDSRSIGSKYNMYGASASNPYALTWPIAGQPFSLDGNFTSVFTQLPWNQLQALNPIVMFAGSTSSGSAVLSNIYSEQDNWHLFVTLNPGAAQTIWGPNIPVGTTVSSINDAAQTITMSNPASATSARGVYSMRLSDPWGYTF